LALLQGDGKRAVEWLEHSDNLGASSLTLEHLGDAYQLLKDWSQAKASYARAIRALESQTDAGEGKSDPAVLGEKLAAVKARAVN
jgi:hypothetical protein